MWYFYDMTNGNISPKKPWMQGDYVPLYWGIFLITAITLVLAVRDLLVHNEWFGDGQYNRLDARIFWALLFFGVVTLFARWKQVTDRPDK